MLVSPNSRLITFGDSWTGGHGVETNIQYKEVIDCGEFTNRLRVSNGWPKFLSSHLDIPFVNFGWCNLSNPEIIDIIKREQSNFHEDDIIVVMLSYAYRGNGDPRKDIPELTKTLDGTNYFILNSFYPTFMESPLEDLERFDLSRFLRPHNTMSEYLVNWERDKKVSPWEYGFKNVDKEGSFLGGDYHPNIEGYKVLAWEIYNLILNHS